MATVEDGIIRFSGKEEFRRAKKACPGCPLNLACSGPDSKTNQAEIHPTMSFKPTDSEITAQANCVKSSEE
jgi:hypothetical protein